MPGLLIIMFTAVLWVFVVRLVKQRQIAAHRAFTTSLAPGDVVTTASGIFGTVREIDEQRCRLEVAPGVVIEIVPVVINRRVDAAAGAVAGADATAAATTSTSGEDPAGPADAAPEPAPHPTLEKAPRGGDD